MNLKSTKKALISSLLILTLCFSMLVGTTFAWFTDSVTSSGNIIKSGTLKLDFEKWDTENDQWVKVEGAIFNYTNWEPGYTQIVNLRLKNIGTLALKWQATIATEDSLSDLADVINIYVRSDEDVTNEELVNYITDVENTDRFSFDDKVGTIYKKYTLRQFINNLTSMTKGTLEENKMSYLGLVVQMDPSAGNEYQGLSLGGKFDLKILATQASVESDSFNEMYDVTAPFVGSSSVPAPSGNAVEATVTLLDSNNKKIAIATVPKDAIADDAEEVLVNIGGTSYTPKNEIVVDNETVITFDVTVAGLKEDNTTPVKIEYYIGKGYDDQKVKVYHYDTGISSTYDPDTGYVTFYSADFSPFSIGFDSKSVYVPPVVEPEIPDDGGDPIYPDAPQANVNKAPQYANTYIEWGSYGVWSPDTTVEANPQLDAVYVFSCQQTLEEAKKSPYAQWECDFFVKLDKDLGENEIFLGGNYGSFGWVGFHNGEVVLNANEEVALLGSVTNGAWKYVDVVQNVGTFICGVGDVGTKLADKGATFTVTLRLTNPADRDQTIDVAVINYEFGSEFCKLATSEETLVAAFANAKEGDTVALLNDIDAVESIVIPAGVTLDCLDNTITYKGTNKDGYDLVVMNTNSTIQNANLVNYRVYTSSNANGEITANNVVINMDNDLTGLDISRGKGTAVLNNVTCKNITDAAHLDPNTQVQVDYTPYGDVLLGTAWGVVATDCDFGSFHGWNSPGKSNVYLNSTTITVFRMHYWPTRTLYIDGVETAWSESNAIPVGHDVGGCWSVMPEFK